MMKFLGKILFFGMMFSCGNSSDTSRKGGDQSSSESSMSRENADSGNLSMECGQASTCGGDPTGIWKTVKVCPDQATVGSAVWIKYLEDQTYENKVLYTADFGNGSERKELYDSGKWEVVENVRMVQTPNGPMEVKNEVLKVQSNRGGNPNQFQFCVSGNYLQTGSLIMQRVSEGELEP